MQKAVNSRNHGLVLFNPYIGPLSGATSLGQSGPGSDGNEGVLCIPHSKIQHYWNLTIRLFSAVVFKLFLPPPPSPPDQNASAPLF